MDAADVIASLGMQPHPEGGWYVETYRAPEPLGGRAAMTAIYFLLEAGQRSHWHKVDATEVWLWHAGAPLTLRIAGQDDVTLGPDLAVGQRPQGVVPKDAWQAAEATAGWALVSCIVAPGFEFAGFELALPGWQLP